MVAFWITWSTDTLKLLITEIADNFSQGPGFWMKGLTPVEICQVWSLTCPAFCIDKYCPKVLNGVELRGLCRHVMIFHNNLEKHFFMDPALCTRTLLWYKQERTLPQYPHNWWWITAYIIKILRHWNFHQPHTKSAWMTCLTLGRGVWVWMGGIQLRNIYFVYEHSEIK